jgi:hypothetical protein
MSGYVMAFGQCIGCGRYFGYNPLRVPSWVSPITNTREPICGTCMQRVNELRVEAGMEPHPIYPDAYDACGEDELP